MNTITHLLFFLLKISLALILLIVVLFIPIWIKYVIKDKNRARLISSSRFVTIGKDAAVLAMVLLDLVPYSRKLMFSSWKVARDGDGFPFDKLVLALSFFGYYFLSRVFGLTSRKTTVKESEVLGTSEFFMKNAFEEDLCYDAGLDNGEGKGKVGSSSSLNKTFDFGEGDAEVEIEEDN